MSSRSIGVTKVELSRLTMSWVIRSPSCSALRISRDIVNRLNSTFVTPIDREDIYSLATQMDDIVDYTEEAADFLGLYQIEAPMAQAQALTKVLVGACEQLAAGLQNLRGFKNLERY